MFGVILKKFDLPEGFALFDHVGNKLNLSTCRLHLAWPSYLQLRPLTYISSRKSMNQTIPEKNMEKTRLDNKCQTASKRLVGLKNKINQQFL